MERMTRLMVFDHTDAFVCEIDPARVLDARSISEVNGEHSITLTTMQELEKTNRLLICDGMGIWHEYVVLGVEDYHTAGGAMAHEYYCVWSLQYDLSATFINDQYGCGVVPGHASVPQTARTALECALAGTSRWTIGTISVTAMSSASFYRRSGWEGMQTVVERWGGEITATITVTTTGVAARQVNLLAHEGVTTATRRFDYGADVTSIKRIVSDEVWPCRIVPLGKSMETEAGGYTRRPSIESVNDGVIWLEDSEAVPLTRVPDGAGGWEYPTLIIKNDTYEDPADLLTWAQAHKSEYCRPIVSYEATVAQFVQAGMDAHGVALGDEVVVVDRTFTEGGLRITSRVIRIEQSLLDPSDVKLTIGNAQQTLAGQLSDIATSVAALGEQVSSGSDFQTTATYLSALLGRLNTEANATGGYTYITEGQGLRTYDVAVADPTSGLEAGSVVEIKGGTIRIANSKTSSGDWDWKTVFTSGHVAAEMISVVSITSGYIGNADGTARWDLDAGELIQRDSDGNILFQLNANGAVFNNSLVMTLDGYRSGAKVYANLGNFTFTDATGIFNGVTTEQTIKGLRIYSEGERTAYEPEGDLVIVPHQVANQTKDAAIYSARALRIYSSAGLSTPIMMRFNTGDGNSSDGVSIRLSTTKLMDLGYSRSSVLAKQSGATSSRGLWMTYTTANFQQALTVLGNLSVTGTKNRLVGTDSYGDRLLYCLETPSPLFEDVGSGTIGEDGLCFVEVDAIFAETARTDIGYQVFLQKCGPGDLWVAEKHQTHFVVEGTPGLRFDWRMACHQTGYETEHLEDHGTLWDPEDLPEWADGDETLAYDAAAYVNEIEALYRDELGGTS